MSAPLFGNINPGETLPE
ncbi:rCG48221, partial [Rattus norvegicus]